MLTLPIKKKWFDMIRTGEKKEEYRTRNDYYYTRFKKIVDKIENGEEQYILLRNGYSSNSPTLKIKVDDIVIGGGREEWGFISPVMCFVIKIASVEEIKNDQRRVYKAKM